MTDKMRPRRHFARFLLLALVAGALFGSFRLGLVPAHLTPLPALSLAERPSWFVDTRLAMLKRDRALCEAVLKPPHIDAVAIPDSPYKNGCGWLNAVRFRQAGGAQLGADRMTCDMAAGLALWIAHEVQPAAMTHLGERVTRIGDMGVYDCRNIIGSTLLKNVRSQHATANAIDISGFSLANGKQVSVLKHWTGDTAEARFLKAVHASACRYFRVALGPEFNAAHKNHFHFDRGAFSRCK